MPRRMGSSIKIHGGTCSLHMGHGFYNGRLSTVVFAFNNSSKSYTTRSISAETMADKTTGDGFDGPRKPAEGTPHAVDMERLELTLDSFLQQALRQQIPMSLTSFKKYAMWRIKHVPRKED